MSEVPSPIRRRAAHYGASDIRVLSGLEPVRVRPAMYIGALGVQGLHHLVFELVQNAIDEALAGHCSRVTVTIDDDRTCTVEDDGRGIPVDAYGSTGRPACEVVLTTLHSGGKFGRGGYPIAGGLHGIGLSCVNALAASLDMDVWRDGAHHRQHFENGVPVELLRVVGPSSRSGTRIAFRADTSILGPCELSFDVLARRLREVAFLCPGLDLRLSDGRSGRRESFAHDSGLEGFVEYLNRGKVPVHPQILRILGEDSDVRLDLAMQWTTGFSEQVSSYVNGVGTVGGGAHVEGLNRALTRVLSEMAVQQELPGSVEGESLAGFDIREGLTAVISIEMPDPEFDSQTKSALTNGRVGEVVASLVESRLRALFEDEPRLGREILGKALEASRARRAARRAGERAHYRGLSSVISKEVYRAQFGIRSGTWHASAKWITDRGLLAAHAEACDVGANARLLDVCCGSGVVGASFRGRVGKLVGLDLTPQMVGLARTRLDEVYQGDVYDLPFDDASFDIVVNREVLHLLPCPDRPVRQIFRVLKPGGQFIVGQLVPFSDMDAPWMYRILKKKQPLFFNNFTAESFRELLEGCGFVDIEMTEYLQWEDIDLWIDTHETSNVHRHEIRQLYRDAPAAVRAVHPFEIATTGHIRDCWRWCVFSGRKPMV